MKIVVAGLRGFPGVQGGVEKHCEELYPRLAQLGCQIIVISRSPYMKRNKKIKEWQKIRFYHLWCPTHKSLEALSHTFLSILKAKTISPDILHLHAIGPALFAPLAKALGLKVVMTHHGPDYKRAKWGRAAKIILKLGEKLGVKYSDKIIAISKGIQAELKNRYNRDSIFIPNGVREPSFILAGKELARWKLKPKEYVFCACRFVPEKGLHDLIEAYKRIDNAFFKLVIAGDADHETDYSRRLKRMAMETPGVILTGIKTGQELAELFSHAGLFVLPSYYEGLPIALLEALSYGLPVLVSDIPPHRELPLPDERFFPPGDKESLSNKINYLIRHGISEDEKKDHWDYLKKNYNWDSIAQMTFEVYKDLAFNAPARP